MVEAPGTAPGSEWLITKAIYRHSRLAPTALNIGLHGGEKKIDALLTPSRESGCGAMLEAEKRGLVVQLELDDLAAPGIDFYLDLMAAGILAFDLPDAVVEFDLFDLNDALGEGHIADIVDVEVGGKGGDGKAEAHGES
jgi:hypothetical protein